MQLSTLSTPLLRPILSPVARPRIRWRKLFVAVITLGLLLALALETGRVLFGNNFHEVLPGRVYRSAQLKPDELRTTIQKHNIRTVINLRGCCSTFDWYLDECRITNELNVSMEDITLSATRLPARSEIQRLIDVLEHCDYPVLFHCRQGADRTSLASVVALLLISNADLPTAREQCTLRFAHVPMLATKEMDRFVDMYEGWLGDIGQPHSPARFREWAFNVYTPDPCPARLELLDPMKPGRVGESMTLRLRATNLSNAVWTFKPGSRAGVHARYVVIDSESHVVGLYRAGRFEATVPPGGSIDLTLPLPPLKEAGKYRVNIDLADKNLNFAQLGSEFLDIEIEVTQEASGAAQAPR